MEKKDGNDYIVASYPNEQQLVVTWAVSEQKCTLVSSYFNHAFAEFIKALRIYDVTSIVFNGANAHTCHEVFVREDSKQWTITGLNKHRSYCVEWGIKLNENKFFPILRSNIVQALFPEHMKPSDSGGRSDGQSPEWKEYVSSYSYYTKESKGEA
ncbi:hypothetical protein J2S17_001319 [Cytobacillus purgationiresistens]|uniref:Transposase n=1 Tax=Cytobacillus purgationiresistens TaxID=863449 RepID=A0ABU0AGA8_9BACI|nr:hypothetical protein [Cytobacillus purgationiresistens]